MENLTTMESLEQLTVEKLKRRIAFGAKNGASAFDKLVEEGKIARDFILPIGMNTRKPNQSYLEHRHGTSYCNFFYDGNVKTQIGLEIQEEFDLNANAIRQLGDKLGVPPKYLLELSRGAQWEKSLCAQILNEETANTARSRVLVRAVGEEVRGVLSDQYRRLNSVDIVKNFVEVAYAQGAVLADGLLTDTKMFVEVLLPDPIVFETPKNGLAVMAYGAQLSTSDYGDGALDLRVFNMQGICLNGMTRDSVMRTIHLGSRLPDNLQLSERTYRLDTQTQVSTIKDLTKGLFSRERIITEMEEIQDASYAEVNLEREIKELPKKGLTKSESLEVGRILTNGKLEDGVQGEPSLWKLVNGVTALGRDTEGARGREIQAIAGKLMDRVKKKS